VWAKRRRKVCFVSSVCGGNSGEPRIKGRPGRQVEGGGPKLKSRLDLFVGKSAGVAQGNRVVNGKYPMEKAGRNKLCWTLGERKSWE